MQKEEKKISALIRYLLKEMIPVILGILIALFLNNWKEERDSQQFVDTVLSSISEEFQENKAELEDILIKRKVLLDTINFYKFDEDVTVGDILGKVNGLQGALIKNISWKAILNSKIEFLEYRKISTLTDVDLTIEHMKFQTQRLADYIFDNIGATDSTKKEVFSISISDLLYTESDLLTLHKEYLEISDK